MMHFRCLRHANWPGVRQPPICQARPSTIPGQSTSLQTRYGPPYRRSAHTDAQRNRMPAASRITMSLNTVSVSTMPPITPVISSSTNPCIADQNSSAA